MHNRHHKYEYPEAFLFLSGIAVSYYSAEKKNTLTISHLSRTYPHLFIEGYRFLFPIPSDLKHYLCFV